MIVDVHTHVGEYPEHISEEFAADARTAWPEVKLGNTLDEHYAEALVGVDSAIVLAFNAPPAGFIVPNDYVAAYVARDPDRLIGFGSVDPMSPHALDELERMTHDLRLQGCKMGPIYQNIDPLSRSFLRVCERVQRLDIPLLIHQGTTFSRAGSLLFANPLLIDEIALRYPRLKIIVAHLGHPWVNETIAVVRRHPCVYADVSALITRRWQLYQALVTAMEYRVETKLLFGTDFPYFTAQQTMDGLRSITGDAFGPRMPVVTDECVEGIIHRPALELLGIPRDYSKARAADEESSLMTGVQTNSAGDLGYQTRALSRALAIIDAFHAEGDPVHGCELACVARSAQVDDRSAGKCPSTVRLPPSAWARV